MAAKEESAGTYREENNTMKNTIIVVIAVLVLMLVLAMASGSGGSSSRSSRTGSSNSCAICGKSPANKCTYDGVYYCTKHYADAWNFYNKKGD